jgi:hypothetical protein
MEHLMKHFVLLTATLVCSHTIIQNLSGQPWTQRDSLVLSRAKLHCGEWDKSYPCVKLFRKKSGNGYTIYNVVCGMQRKN